MSDRVKINAKRGEKRKGKYSKMGKDIKIEQSKNVQKNVK